jgi:hypothetical protein
MRARPISDSRVGLVGSAAILASMAVIWAAFSRVGSKARDDEVGERDPGRECAGVSRDGESALAKLSL